MNDAEKLSARIRRAAPPEPRPTIRIKEGTELAAVAMKVFGRLDHIPVLTGKPIFIGGPMGDSFPYIFLDDESITPDEYGRLVDHLAQEDGKKRYEMHALSSQYAIALHFKDVAYEYIHA